MKHIKIPRAFTLVELIVVITILAILGTMGFVSLFGYQQSSRDVVRLTDINTISRGVSLFGLEEGGYPDTASGFIVSYSGSTLWEQGYFTDEVRRKIGRLIDSPVDPLLGQEYIYSVTYNNQEFQIGGALEAMPALASHFIPKTHAGFLSAIVKGNYNGVIIGKEINSDFFIFSVPSIISQTFQDVDISKLIQDDLFVVNNYSGMPYGFTDNAGNTPKLNLNITHSGSYIAFSGSKEDIGTYSGALQIGQNIKNFYSDTPLYHSNDNSGLKKLLSIDANNPQSNDQVVSYVDTLLGSIQSTLPYIEDLIVVSPEVENGVSQMELTALNNTKLINTSNPVDMTAWIGDFIVKGSSPNTFFSGHAGNISESYQVVTVTGALHSLVDSESLEAKLLWEQSSYSGEDKGAMRIEFLDESGTVISNIRSNYKAGATNSWSPNGLHGDIPSGTRFLRVSMLGQRIGGTNNDSYINNINLTVQEKTSANEYVLRNTDAELFTSYWNPNSYFGFSGSAGNRYFYGGNHNSNSSASQTVKIQTSDYSDIDSENLMAVLNWEQSSHDRNDRGAMRIEFLNDSNTVISNIQSSYVASQAGVWEPYELSNNIPSGTRSVRITMLSNRKSGISNDAKFDNLSLMIQNRAGVIPYTLKNGNADLSASYWTTSSNFGVLTSGSERYFYGGNSNSNSSANQILEVHVNDYTNIDAGASTATLDWEQSSWAGDDRGAMKIDFLDNTQTLISNIESSYIASPSGVWTPYQLSGSIPAGTRFFRITMLSNRRAGSNNDARFDNLNFTVSN